MQTDSDFFRANCPECGQAIECPNDLCSEQVTCPNCNAQFIAEPEVVGAKPLPTGFSTKVGPQKNKAGETIFFDEAGILITNARFVVGDQMFPMAGITSVKKLTRNPNRIVPCVIIFFGLFILAANWAVGLIWCGATVGFMFVQKSVHVVALSTAGGELTAYQSLDSGLISRIVAALNLAIIDRG